MYIGHKCVLKACTVESNCVVGAGSILEEGSYMEQFSMLAAGSVLKKGSRINTFEVCTTLLPLLSFHPLLFLIALSFSSIAIVMGRKPSQVPSPFELGGGPRYA